MFTMTLADAFSYVRRVLHQVRLANQEAMIHIRLAGVMFDVFKQLCQWQITAVRDSESLIALSRQSSSTDT